MKSPHIPPGRQWRHEELLPGCHLLLPRQRRPYHGLLRAAALGLPLEPGDGGGGGGARLGSPTDIRI